MSDFSRSWLAPEGPINLDRDVLFQEREELWAKLGLLADHITAAVLSADPVPAAVFGISAPWGAGKSSALRVIIDLLFGKLRGHLPGLDRDSHGFFLSGDEHILTASTFRANLHAASQQPARLGLAYEVLQGFPQPYRDELLDDLAYDKTLANPGKKGAAVGSAAPLLTEIFLRERLGEYARTGPSIEEWILRSFLGYRANRSVSQRTKHVHVELIDDLDRCSESYTADVLAALNFWSTLDDVFFVIAADERHLQRSAQTATELHERYPGEALEKFIHVQLRLPDLIGDYTQAATFAARLIPDSDDLPPGVQHLRTLLAEAGSAGPLGLMAPVLQVHTPRQAKRILNGLLQEFWSLRDLEGDSAKRIVARLAWPQEFDSYILPELIPAAEIRQQTDASLRSEWLRLLLRAARKALQGDDNDLAAKVSRFEEMTRTGGLDLRGCPSEMLLYLVAPPGLQLPPAADGLDQTFRRQDPLMREPRHFSPGAGPNPQGARQTVSDLALALQTAYATEKTNEVVGAAKQLISFGQSQSLPTTAGAHFGNAALRVARVDLDLAWQLHQLAVATDPEQANIRLNFVDFLLDYGGPAEQEMVLEQLQWARENAADFDPGRQRLLWARLAVVKGEPLVEPEQLVEDVTADDTNSSNQWERLHVLAASTNFDLLEQAAMRWIQLDVEQGESRNIGTALRQLADGLGGAPIGSEMEARGIDVMRHVLCTGFSANDDILSGAAGNLGGLLPPLGFVASAAVLLRIAYELDPRDPAIRSSYSRFLLTYREDGVNAYAVQQGQEVTIPTPVEDQLAEAFQELPPTFSTDNPWWTTYRPSEPYARPPYSPMTTICPGVS